MELSCRDIIVPTRCVVCGPEAGVEQQGGGSVDGPSKTPSRPFAGEERDWRGRHLVLGAGMLAQLWSRTGLMQPVSKDGLAPVTFPGV